MLQSIIHRGYCWIILVDSVIHYEVSPFLSHIMRKTVDNCIDESMRFLKNGVQVIDPDYALIVKNLRVPMHIDNLKNPEHYLNGPTKNWYKREVLYFVLYDVLQVCPVIQVVEKASDPEIHKHIKQKAEQNGNKTADPIKNNTPFPCYFPSMVLLSDYSTPSIIRIVDETGGSVVIGY